MGKHGQYSFVIGKEIDRGLNRVKEIAMGVYSGKGCKKPQRIHIAIHDLYRAPDVHMGDSRCSCGGYTFSPMMGSDKVVCRHCGKVYTTKEFKNLPHKELNRAEKENRHIFAILLAGGDLREDREEDVLILKNHIGIPEGDLPLSYATYFAKIYRDAQLVRTTLATKKEERIELLKAQALSL